MPDYNIVHVATNTMYTFSIYQLFHAFFDGDVHDKHKEGMSYFCYFILSSALVFVTRVPWVTLVFTFILLFLISLNYHSSIQKKIIFTSLICSILLVIEIIVSVGIGFIDISVTVDSSFDSAIGLVLIRTVTLIAAYLTNRYRRVINKEFPISKIYYLAFSVVLLGTLYLFAFSLENDGITLYNVVLNGAILIIVNMTMIIMDEKIYHSIIAMKEKQVLEQQNITYENQARVMSQSMETIKSIRHDMKNHLIMLNRMYANHKMDEIEPYIGKIIKKIDQGVVSESKNFMIDSIINFKLRQLYDTDTAICLNIQVPQTVNISAYDLTVILGNLLDNAITALKQAQNKKLDISISSNMGNLIILMENSYSGKLKLENGKFKTVKADKRSHGIGLSNVEKALENYGGEMRTEYTDDIFSVSVIIPCEE